MIPLAALVLTAAATWPAPGARVHVALHGRFDDRAPWHVNLVNAPAADHRRPPPPLPISAELLDALNAELPTALDGVLGSLGLKVEHGEKALKRLQAGAQPLTSGEGDARFTLALTVAGDDELGGHRGGLELRAQVHSLQRAPDIAGEGTSTVELPHDRAQASLFLRGALLDAVSRAFTGLHEQLNADQSQPRFHVLLRVDAHNLDAKQRHAAAGLARCAAKLADPVEVADLDGGSDALLEDVELRAARFDPGETQAAAIQSWAGRIELETGLDGKFHCSRWHSGLEPYELVVLAEPDAGEVRVRFDPPDDAGAP